MFQEDMEIWLLRQFLEDSSALEDSPSKCCCCLYQCPSCISSLVGRLNIRVEESDQPYLHMSLEDKGTGVQLLYHLGSNTPHNITQ